MDALVAASLDSLAEQGARGDRRATSALVARLHDSLQERLRTEWLRGPPISVQAHVPPLAARLERDLVTPEKLQTYLRRKQTSDVGFLHWAHVEAIDIVCDELARRGAAGNEQSIQFLVTFLHDRWVTSISCNWRLRYSEDPEDTAREIAVSLFSKLKKTETLASYVQWVERSPGKSFADWMNIVVANSMRTHLRMSRKSVRNLIRMHGGVGPDAVEARAITRPQFTNLRLFKELIAIAKDGCLLTDPQIDALYLWLEGGTFQEVAQELGCAEKEAQGLIRAAIAKFRRKFPR